MATTHRKTVIGALGEIAEKISTTSSGEVPNDVAGVTKHQQVFLRYSEGPGTVSADGKHVILKFKLYKFNNKKEYDGTLDVVFESTVDPSKPFTWPSPPKEPFDDASGVPKVEVRGYSKSRWSFANGSEIIGVGPTVVNVARFKDETSMLFVEASYTITSGTGQYDDARGTVAASGASLLPKGTVFGPGITFDGTALEAFRVVSKNDFK